MLQVEDKTVAGLLALIEADRNGESVDKTLLKHLVRMFTNLGTYASAFEEAFLGKTKQYYSREGQHFMQESDVADYLLHCEVWVHCCMCHSCVMHAFEHVPRFWMCCCCVLTPLTVSSNPGSHQQACAVLKFHHIASTLCKLPPSCPPHQPNGRTEGAGGGGGNLYPPQPPLMTPQQSPWAGRRLHRS